MVERGTVWTDTVKRGPMLRQVVPVSKVKKEISGYI